MVVLLLVLLAEICLGQSNWGYGLGAEAQWASMWPTCNPQQNPAQSPIDFSQVPVSFALRAIPQDWEATAYANISIAPRKSLLIKPLDHVPAIAHPLSHRFYLLDHVAVFSPSLHSFGGARRDVEVQLVHVLEHSSTVPSQPQDFAGQLLDDAEKLIVSFTYRANSLRTNNRFLSSLFGPAGFNLTSGPTNRTINYAAGVPSSRDYYTYRGSDAMPPCAPGVEYFVYAEDSPMSALQLDDIRRSLGFSLSSSEVATPPPANLSASSFSVEGNVRSVQTKGIIPSTDIRRPQRFMDFVGDDILRKRMEVDSFSRDIMQYASAALGLSIAAAVISLLALRIGSS